MAPSGATVSQFSYRYDPDGQIKQWQQIQNNSSQNYVYQYDDADQLIGAKSCPGQLSNAYSNQYGYTYDLASNRASNYSSTITKAKISGTITVGDIITVTVKDQGLSGGSKAFAYTVVSGDTLNSIALALATIITKDIEMQNLGINAVPSANYLSLKSVSTNVTSFEGSVSSGATETIRVGITGNFVQNAEITGTKTTGDILTLKVIDPSLSGGSKNVSYTVLSTDTLSNIATGLKNAVNADASLSALGVTATNYGQVVTIRSASETATTYEQSTNSGATEKIGLSINQNALQRVAISGSKTTGDTITFTVYDQGLTNGYETLNYTVLSGDTLTSIASNIASSINSSTDLQNIGLVATSVGQIINVQSDSLNCTALQASTSLTATEIATTNPPANSVQSASLAGTASPGDTIAVTVYDAGLTPGSKDVSYTVLPGNTIANIAQGLATAINSDSDMLAIKVSATADDTTIFISSASLNTTTYKKTLSSGATEILTFGLDSKTQKYFCNDVNEIETITKNGAVRYSADTNKSLQSAAINGNSVELVSPQTFAEDAILNGGSNQISVSATDGASTTVQDNYQHQNGDAPPVILGFDSNGNMTSDGTNSFKWDAEDRLIKITYPGVGNYSQLSYDALGYRVKIVETQGDSITSTKQFVCSDDRSYECRDGSGNMLNQYFLNGQTIGGSPYCYTRDHLGSVREMADSTSSVQAQYRYDPFGRVSKLQGALSSDFQNVIGCYFHTESGLNFSWTRSYNSALGRWISRDSIEEEGGINLFEYVLNDPVAYIDPSGLVPKGFKRHSAAPPPYKNCYVGDASCCGYNRNRCLADCPSCDERRAAAPKEEQGEYPTTQRCKGCCREVYNSCWQHGQYLRWQIGLFGGWVAFGGHKFQQCSQSGSRMF